MSGADKPFEIFDENVDWWAAYGDFLDWCRAQTTEILIANSQVLSNASARRNPC